MGGISNPTLVDFGENVTDIKTGNEGSYSINVLVDYKIGKRMRLSTGIGFATEGFSWNYGRDYYDMETMEELFPELVNWNYTTITAKYFSIGIPLSVKYDLFNTKNIGLYFKPGTYISYLFDGNWQTEAEFTDREDVVNTTNQNPSDGSNLMIGGQIGFGIDINLTNKSRLFVEPCYHYNITKVRNTFPLDGNLYNFGINIGLMVSVL
jgi:hypothetical protein